MTKINKTAARKLYNQGKSFTIVPCNIHPRLGITFKAEWAKMYKDFEAFVTRFEYYYCVNHETGRCAAYYIDG